MFINIRGPGVRATDDGFGVGTPVGPPGPKGDKPDHVWTDTAIAFENPDGTLETPVEIGLPDRGTWATDTVYAERDWVRLEGSSYAASVGHTSSSTNRPGTGAGWQLVWVVLAEKGADGVDLGAVALASQAEAEAGTINDEVMTPLRTAQAIHVRLAAIDIYNEGARPESGDQRDVIQAALDLARDDGMRPVVGRSGRFAIRDGAVLTAYTPFNGNGMTIVLGNDGRLTSIFTIESVAADIVDYDLAFVQTWNGAANLPAGLAAIPELVGYESQSFLTRPNFADQVSIERQGGPGSGDYSLGVKFVVLEDGRLSSPLKLPANTADWTLPLITGQRRHVRDPITIQCVKFLYEGTATGETANTFFASRPNVHLEEIIVRNDSTMSVHGGIALGVWTTHRGCRVSGLDKSGGADDEGYACSGGYQTEGWDFREWDNRRGFDGEAIDENRFFKSRFFSGFGTHYGLGCGTNECFIHSAENICLQIGGGEYVSEGDTFELSDGATALYDARPDAPEARGLVAIRNATINIRSTAGSTVRLLDFRTGNIASYDAGREYEWPRLMELTGVVNDERAAGTFTEVLRLGRDWGAGFTQDILGGGDVNIDLKYNADDYGGAGSSARVHAHMFKPTQLIGNRNKIRLANLPHAFISVNTNATRALDPVDPLDPDQRYDLLLENIGLGESTHSGLDLNFGAFRRIAARNCGVFDRTTATGGPFAPHDDEVVFGVLASVSPVGGVLTIPPGLTGCGVTAGTITTINGAEIGDEVMFFLAGAGPVIFDNGADHIWCGSDRTLNNVVDTFTARFDGTVWKMTGFADNG